MDLRDYLEQIQNQLKTVEQESIDDIMQNQEEVAELCLEIRNSNESISRLERLLSSFQQDLSNISSEIKALKEKSLAMSISLNNRKTLESNLSEFLKNVALSPELIHSICNHEINEDYLTWINELRDKIQFFKSQEKYLIEEKQVAAIAMQDVLPELKKLINKAASRLRVFLIDHIQALTKPKSNVQLMQETILIKFKDFLLFLRENSQETFVEICMYYTETLSQVYLHHFKLYLTSLKKLIRDESNKQDMVVSENIDYKVHYVPSFDLRDRHLLIERIEDTDPIISHSAKKANHKFYIEQIFHSISRLLVDTCSYNFAFVIDFFSIRPEQYGPVFGEIFTKTFQYLLDNLGQVFASSFDMLALLLVLKINSIFQSTMERRNILLMNTFFERLRMIVWPKLQHLLDRNIHEMDSAEYLRATDILVHPVTRRFSQLIIGLYKISPSDDMFRQRLTLFKKAFNGLLSRLAQEIRDEKNRKVFMINNLEYLLGEFEHSPAGEFAEIEGQVWELSEEFIDLQLLEVFGGIMSVLNSPANIQLQQAETLIHDFNANWKKSLSLVQTIERDLFANEGFQKEILKRTYTKFLMKFNDFSDVVKKSFPGLTKHLLPVHAVMAEIQK